MDYRKYAPPASLKNYIRYYWSFDSLQSDASEFRVKSFADRYPRLIFQILNQFKSICNLQGEELPPCYLSGIDTQNTEAVFGGTFSHFGASFYPHALNAFFRIDAHELINKMPDIQCLCKAEIQHQLERAESHFDRVQLLNKYFYDKLFNNRNRDLIIDHIIQQNDITTESQIFSLSDKYNISERHLERKFKSVVGISPKKLQRIIRFEKALELLNNIKYSQLTAVSYQLNYTDQSHFIKDFKAFSGITPYEFVKNRILGAESSSFIYVAD